MLEPIVLTPREREFIAIHEQRKQQAFAAHREAEAAQKAIALCIIERAGGDIAKSYQLSEDGSSLVPIPTAPTPEA